jgi:hypothetical protein
MAKRVLLVLVLAAVVAGGVFAKEEPLGGKKNFLSAVVGLIGGGARYERMFGRKLGIGMVRYYSTLFVFNEMEMGLFGRFYPWEGKFFAEMGLGYHVHTAISGSDFETTTGVAVSPGLGWKFDPGNNGFFVEPAVNIPIIIGTQTATGSVEREVGVAVGVLVYVGLGWAF